MVFVWKQNTILLDEDYDDDDGHDDDDVLYSLPFLS